MQPRFIPGRSLLPPSLAARTPLSSSGSVSITEQIAIAIAQARTLRRTPRTLPPLLKLLDSSHFAYCASLLALVRALMNYGTPIRFHDSGRAALGLIDLFCVVTRCVTYLSDEAVELVAKASKLVESLQRKDGKAQEKFCEFLQARIQHSDRWTACRNEMWQYLKIVDSSLPRLHEVLTDQRGAVPLLLQLKAQAEDFFEAVKGISSVWLEETPAVWQALQNDISGLHRSSQTWSSLVDPIRATGSAMRSEFASLLSMSQKLGFITRDEAAAGLRSLWEAILWQEELASEQQLGEGEGGKQGV